MFRLKLISVSLNGFEHVDFRKFEIFPKQPMTKLVLCPG
jgi:hypothetical protein